MIDIILSIILTLMVGRLFYKWSFNKGYQARIKDEA